MGKKMELQFDAIYHGRFRHSGGGFNRLHCFVFTRCSLVSIPLLLFFIDLHVIIGASELVEICQLTLRYSSVSYIFVLGASVVLTSHIEFVPASHQVLILLWFF